MPSDAGKRNRYVTIQALTESISAGSFPVETWTTLRQEWASRRDMSAQERFGAGQMTASFETSWELGYSPEMDPEIVDVPKTRRLSWQGRTYEIVAARAIGLRAGIEVMTLAASKVA